MKLFIYLTTTVIISTALADLGDSYDHDLAHAAFMDFDFDEGTVEQANPFMRLARGRKKYEGRLKRLIQGAFSIAPNHIIAEEANDVNRMESNFVNAIVYRVMEDRKNYGRVNKTIINTFKGMSMNEGPTDRFLNCDDPNCQVPLSLRGVWGYGCWCNFGVDLMKGKGPTVNAHDSACERMQQCLRCARIDGITDGYNCDPKVSSYNAVFFPVSGSTSLNSGCASQNVNNPCGTHVCTCEMQFINDILDLVWTGYRYDPAFTHPSNPMGGVFDDDASCQSTTGVSEMECCGSYPSRYPYNTLDRDCCDADGLGATFNPFDQVCCINGVQAIGSGSCII